MPLLSIRKMGISYEKLPENKADVEIGQKKQVFHYCGPIEEVLRWAEAILPIDAYLLLEEHLNS